MASTRTMREVKASGCGMCPLTMETITCCSNVTPEGIIYVAYNAQSRNLLMISSNIALPPCSTKLTPQNPCHQSKSRISKRPARVLRADQPPASPSVTPPRSMTDSITLHHVCEGPDPGPQAPLSTSNSPHLRQSQSLSWLCSVSEMMRAPSSVEMWLSPPDIYHSSCC